MNNPAERRILRVIQVCVVDRVSDGKVLHEIGKVLAGGCMLGLINVVVKLTAVNPSQHHQAN